MKFNRKTILLTGGCGYIGSHTCIELLQADFEVIVVDNLSNSNVQMLDRVKTITGKNPVFYNIDLSDKNALQNASINFESIDSIIHFAALKSVNESCKIPLKYYFNNLNCMINVLELMKTFHIKNLIFSSSCTVYGNAINLPVTESAQVLPANSPYGNTKQICEEIIYDAIHSSNLNIQSVVLRYFNPVGAHISGKIGELPIGVPNNLMPYITQTAIGIRPQLKVYGGDYSTPDGTAIRDYIHVSDLARAHVLAMQALINGKIHKPIDYINLGTGKGSSVLEVIQSFERSTGEKLPYCIVDRREGDIEEIYASNQKAKELLNWYPKYTLDDMTKSAWIWEQNYRKEKNDAK